MKSFSPRMGNVIRDFRRLILSRNMRFENIQHIMWTNCASLLVCPVAHVLAGDRQPFRSSEQRTEQKQSARMDYELMKQQRESGWTARWRKSRV